MKLLPIWLPIHRPLLLLLVSASGCSGTRLEDVGVVTKGGLDGPPIAVAPFLDGVFPTKTPNRPGGSEWTVSAAFPNLNLADTLVITSNPADDRIYVASRDGLIVSFENQSDVSTTEAFLDLRDRVAVVWDGGFLGLVFHPEFGNPGSPYRNTFYTYYSSHCPLDTSRDAADLGACDDAYPRGNVGGFFNTYLRLSRFQVFDGTATGDPSTEQVFLNIRLYNGSHRGGGMVFRNDGYLYLTIGDQFHYETAQDIVDTLEGGSFRFAVDVTDNGDGTWSCPAGSHMPRRTFDTADEISGLWYCIPDDNPWLDPGGGLFEEYCSIGHRNPHRVARDPVTDRLWSGEVGEDSREEINIIECGNNYGWPFREGLIAGVRPEPPSFLGILTDPVIDFTRSEARAIIGGYVYRGSKFPELYGRYLAGDYVTNQIWAITLDENTMAATKVHLANFPSGNLATWGQDNAGEVFMGDVASTGPLYTLDRIGDPVADAPPLLSETGALSDVAGLAPSAVWVPYTLNQPFWSDGALKSRFIALPNDGVRDTAAEQIAFSPDSDWTFPTGTVLMKHFELSLDEADPTNTTRLETRFMVLGDDGAWYGLTYRWRVDQTDANLLTTEETGDYTIQLSDGVMRAQTWYFPARLDCLTCHRQGAGGALGPRTHQLNSDFTYPSTGRTDNQIRTWNDLAMFSPPVDDASIPSLGKSPAPGDVTAPLQDRARSWLDANCSHCHRPGGANAGFDARFTTPFVDQAFVWTMVRDDLGNPGTVVIYPGDPVLSAAWQRSAAVGPIAMPPLAKALPEQPAVDLLAEWIERLDPVVVVNNAPELESPGDQNSRQDDVISLDLIATDDDGDSLYFDAAGLPEGLTLDHDAGQISGTLASAGVTSVTVSASDGPAVSVATFEWLVAMPFCGDDITDDDEECDDGNTDDGDGCSSVCEIEPPPMPDGGIPDGGMPDGSVPDGGGVPDGGMRDGGTPDGGVADGGMAGESPGSGCSVRAGGAPIDFFVLLGLLALLRYRQE